MKRSEPAESFGILNQRRHLRLMSTRWPSQAARRDPRFAGNARLPLLALTSRSHPRGATACPTTLTPRSRGRTAALIDDLFFFPGHHSTVLIMDVNSTITGPDVQRGFHPAARYEIKVHFDGGEFEELTYRVSFGQPDPTGRQSLQLHALAGDEARDNKATGTLVLDGQTGASAGMNDTRLWAGRIRDPFYIDLAQLGTVNAAFKNGTAVDRSAWQAADARNSFADTTVESIVIEVSHQHPQLHTGAHIGV